MSKILDLLNYNKWDKSGEPAGREKVEELPDHITPQSFDADTRETLANTYIFNSPDKSKKAEVQSGKNIAPHKHLAVRPHFKFLRVFPWLISFLAVLLLLVNIAFRGKIIVNIDVVREMGPESAPALMEKSQAESGKEAVKPAVETFQPRQETGNLKSIYLAMEGRPNRHIVKKLGFYGAAMNKSRLAESSVLLFNDGTAGYASAGFDLSQPMDLSDSTLDFFVKGSFGRESLKLFLRDASSRSYFPQAIKMIFENNMSADWQFVSIPLKGFDGLYDAEKINHIGFEFGTQTTHNDPGASIYIKNLKIVKK
ncbi:MAG: hypothetical protein ISS26_06295 [Candidatus Omnitrophica bacterium]|nr:hypothetical protein [Candidatus Omnitrophota bacterium]